MTRMEEFRQQMAARMAALRTGETDVRGQASGSLSAKENAAAQAAAMGAELMTGKDYLRLAKSEAEAERLFRARLREAVSGGDLISNVSDITIPDGTILEMTVRRPGEEPVTTNMRVTPEDLELLKELKNLNG